ncbi:hypothetical protein C0J52_27159, partial [Blattella germanica]
SRFVRRVDRRPVSEGVVPARRLLYAGGKEVFSLTSDNRFKINKTIIDDDKKEKDEEVTKDEKNENEDQVNTVEETARMCTMMIK